MPTRSLDQIQLKQIVAEPIIAIQPGRWGFTNRTDIVTVVGGERVVVQRYRRRMDAEYRLRVMQVLHIPAERSGIVIPKIRQYDLDANPPWAIFDLLDGRPVPEVDAVALDSPDFPFFAHLMGDLLARLRQLPTTGLLLNDEWADPYNLVDRAAVWVKTVPELGQDQEAALMQVIHDWPGLFVHRPVVLAHGDFAPVNILTDGKSLTGLVDFEAVRLADPLFDAAWWAWAVEFHSSAVLQRAWVPFLQGAGIDPDEPKTAGSN